MLRSGRRVHPGSLGSLGRVKVHWSAPWWSKCSSGLAVFIGFAPGFAGFIQGCWVHWGAPGGSSGSSGVIVVRTGDRRVILVSLGSLGCALWVVGFIRGRLVH